MFCIKCGKELSDELNFCPYCGAKTAKSLSGNSSVSSIQSDYPSHLDTKNEYVFNRKVLLNYLGNIRTLEFAINKLESDISYIENRIYHLGIQRTIRPVEGFGGISAIIFLGVVFLVSLLINAGINGDGLMSAFQPVLQPIVILAMIASVVIIAIVIISNIVDRSRDVRRYNREVAAEAERLRYEEEEKNYWIEVLPIYKDDLNKTKVLRDKAYSIGIIPDKCRNIYGAHFLYDNISTSTISLMDAIYLFAFDEISRKLDVVIEQQRQIIMELARSNALNEQIVNQNKEILRHAIATERNTALAAQYSQIAAVNSETVSQIQSYYFFKNGL